MMTNKDKSSTEIVNELLRGIWKMKKETHKKAPQRNAESLRRLTIGARIRIARLSMGMEQPIFAHKMGTQAANVSKWEKGINEPRMETIRKIADLTGFAWEWFYKD